MRREIGIFCILAFVCGPALCDSTPLSEQIENVRAQCSGISSKMDRLKRMAGINTAITSVGTVAGGVGLGTGIAKAKVDKIAEQLEAELQAEIDKLRQLAATQTHIDYIPQSNIPAGQTLISDDSPTASQTQQTSQPQTDQADIEKQQAIIKQKQAELDAATQKSKTLGNVRTGTLAGAAVTDAAGTIIAVKNRVDDDLQQRIDNCALAVQELSKASIQAQMEEQDKTLLTRAKNIVQGCNEWRTIDLSKINKRATGAAISSGVGTAMAIAGTATSASANSDRIREDNTEQGKQKEKNLNTASNVLAGGTTVASGVAVVFNATQIKAIKDALQVAENCEKALNQ